MIPARRERCPASGSESVSRLHSSQALKGRGIHDTPARTRAISGWKRESVVGRSA